MHPAIERAKRFTRSPAAVAPGPDCETAIEIIHDLLTMADEAGEYVTPGSASVRCNNLAIDIEGGHAKITIDAHEIRGVREFDLRMSAKSLPVFHFTTLPILTKENNG